MAKVSPAREVAAQTLLTVDSEPLAQAADVLARLAARGGLRGDDIRLARTIVFGVLRHALTLDYYYGEHLTKPADKLELPLRTLLRMATYQKYYLSKVPDYALVNESVELGKVAFRLGPKQIGFLNAVLRKVAAGAEPRKLPTGNRVSDLAVRFSFPPYLAGLFVAKYGTHKAIAIMEACNVEPQLTVRVNTLIADGERLAEALGTDGFCVEPALVAPDAFVISQTIEGTRALFDTDAFLNGWFYVQDEGSQLIAHLVAPAAGERILDLCSAPGGKATHMAELSGGKADITATDFSEARLNLVAANIERLRTPGVVIRSLQDVMDRDVEKYDTVLVDAPCSGMGTIRRNPEIRYRITAEQLGRQAGRQMEVLENAAGLVRRGGRLVYSTCSMSEVENKKVIASFLRSHPEFTIGNEPSALVPAVADLRREDGWYATWPGYPQIDGFEAVVLAKQAD